MAALSLPSDIWGTMQIWPFLTVLHARIEQPVSIFVALDIHLVDTVRCSLKARKTGKPRKNT